MAISGRRFLGRTIKRGFTLPLGASVARAASEPGAPSDKVVLGVVGVGVAEPS
jgi:hypothetical protein